MKLSRLLLAVAGAAFVSFLAGCATPIIHSDPNPIAYKPHNPANVRVKVSLYKQQIYVMEGNRPLLVAATCVGTPAKPTPRGTFRVYNKIADKRSNSYGYWVKGGDIRPADRSHSPGAGYRYVGYPMQYWVEFLPGYGFHQGFIWPIARTHGCLRLHKNVAPKFFELVGIGTPVNIAATQPEDDTIGRNVPRPDDSNAPDPNPGFMVSDQVFARPAGSLLVEQ